MFCVWYCMGTIVNSFQGLQNFKIGELDCSVITAEYRTRVH